MVTPPLLPDDLAQGLGKTLQVLSLIWTLLKQGPEVKKPPLPLALPGVRAAANRCCSFCRLHTSLHQLINPSASPQACRASPRCARRWWSRPRASRRTGRTRWAGPPAAVARGSQAARELVVVVRQRSHGTLSLHLGTVPCMSTFAASFLCLQARKWLGVERMRVMVLSPGPESKQQARGRAEQLPWDALLLLGAGGQTVFCSSNCRWWISSTATRTAWRWCPVSAPLVPWRQRSLLLQMGSSRHAPTYLSLVHASLCAPSPPTRPRRRDAAQALGRAGGYHRPAGLRRGVRPPLAHALRSGVRSPALRACAPCQSCKRVSRKVAAPPPPPPPPPPAAATASSPRRWVRK